jgi:hypothetical protein
VHLLSHSSSTLCVVGIMMFAVRTRRGGCVHVWFCFFRPSKWLRQWVDLLVTF